MTFENESGQPNDYRGTHHQELPRIYFVARASRNIRGTLKVN